MVLLASKNGVLFVSCTTLVWDLPLQISYAMDLASSPVDTGIGSLEITRVARDRNVAIVNFDLCASRVRTLIYRNRAAPPPTASYRLVSPAKQGNPPSGCL